MSDLQTAVESIEYRVRPVARFVVTRWYSKTSEDGHFSEGGAEERGEFDNAKIAYEVGYALCKAEHQQRGWPIGDERIKYPEAPGGEASRA